MKKWLVVVKAPHSVQFVKAFRSEARANRYSRRKNKWTFVTYRVVHYTTWADHLQGKDGIA